MLGCFSLTQKHARICSDPKSCHPTIRSLDSVSKAFRKWPEGLGSDMQSLLQQMSARAILQHSTIIIPTILTLQFTIVPPSEVQGSEHLLGYLVLDLHTTPHDGAHNRELNRGSRSMASLSLLFPNLKSCVFVVTLHHVGRTNSTFMRSYEQPDRSFPAARSLHFSTALQILLILDVVRPRCIIRNQCSRLHSPKAPTECYTRRSSLHMGRVHACGDSC
jgi:hypothetical protein